jgi:hypothetical protein
MAKTESNIQLPKFSLITAYFEGTVLVLLGSILLYSYIFHSLIPNQPKELKYFFIIITTVIAWLFLFKKASIYDDKIVIRYPLLGIRKEFNLDEVKKVHIESRRRLNFISMQFIKPVLLFKFSNFSVISNRTEIADFLKERNVNVIYSRDA